MIFLNFLKGEKLNPDEKIIVKNLSFYYGNYQALKSINLVAKKNEILAIIGPAKSGKTTLLRTLNRLNDLIPNTRLEGDVLLDGQSIYKEEIDLAWLRKKVGMVFALPIPLPRTIFDNIAYGPRLHGITNHARLEELVEKSLKAANLWDEVRDRLQNSALKLSGGQQQRLCIARTLALEPEVILMDEPCSGLDPISTLKIEEAMRQLKREYTIILVTNNTKQAARIADKVAFFLLGELVEYGNTEKIFTTPYDKRTDDYLAGKFG